MKILLAYDLSKPSKSILNVTESHANFIKAEIDILYSMENISYPKEFITYEDAEENLSKIKNDFEHNKISCNIHISTTNLSPGEDIVKYSKNNNIYEIIVGVKKKSRVGKLIMGSTLQYVVLNANCPVVTTKL